MRSRLCPPVSLVVLLAALGGCSTAEPEAVSITLGANRDGAACEPTSITPTVTGEGVGITWSIEGIPTALERAGDGVVLVPPTANRARGYVVTATATDAGGASASASVRVDVPATPPGPGMAPGTVSGCGPFPQGVASGDPSSDGVVLWTRTAETGPLRWVVASDALLDDVVAEGTATADPERDMTIHVEVSGLPAGGTYYYRFFTESGEGSPLGRTKTAPSTGGESFTFAGASCSSLFSGWFNGYHHLAADDVDVVLHVGDYVYDFVDAEEDVRLTDPPPIDPSTLPEWRERFAHYLDDPDFRDARAAHPWVNLWDNHDSDTGTPQGTRQAFREYVPMRQPDASDPNVIHRALRWGDLVDLYVMDAYTMQSADEILGAEQWAWLSAELAASEAAWRVLGTQKLVTTFGDPSGGFVGQATDWDDWPASRTALFAALGAKGDNIILSGDLHFTIAADLVADPLNEQSPYDPTTGAGSVGVELLASGVTRGNFDETICSGPCDDDGNALIENIRGLIHEANPHHRFLELIQHGYGRVTVTPERAEATMRYFPIRWPTDEELPGETLVVERGANRWTR